MSAAVFPPVSIVESHFLLLDQENIDTDQILPGEFLTTVEKIGLGDKAFYRWRRGDDGEARQDSPFDSARARASRILVAGRNFGCGSSREHAAWALRDYGFRVILSPKLGDIFRSNCIMNGILAIEIDTETFDALRKHVDSRLRIDLDHQLIMVANRPLCSFDIDPFASLCLRNGVDPLGFLLANQDSIQRFEVNRSPGASADLH